MHASAPAHCEHLSHPDDKPEEHSKNERPGAMHASIVYQCGGREEVQVHRPEYKCKELIWHLYDKVDWCLGYDGSLLKGDEHVWHVAERKMMRLDYCTGTHKLCFQSGEESVAPVFLTHCDEYVFGYDLVFLRAESHCDHTVFVGRVARLLGGLVRAFRKRNHAKAAKRRRQLETAGPPVVIGRIALVRGYWTTA
jgi:hypothetical protein